MIHQENSKKWTIIKESVKQLKEEVLDVKIKVNYSKKYGHLYATIINGDDCVHYQLDEKIFKGTEGDFIIPETFLVYKKTNGEKVITRCTGDVMSPQMKSCSIFRDKSIGIFICKETLMSNYYLLPIIRGHRIGFINLNAEIIIEPIYDNFKGMFWDRYDKVCIKKDGKWGVINAENYICIKIVHNYILPGVIDRCLDVINRDYLFTVNKENQYAVYNDEGYEIVDFGEYDWISGFDSHLAIVRKGNKYGMIDSSGSIVLAIEYDEIKDFYKKGDSSTTVKKNGRYSEIKFSDLVHRSGNDETYFTHDSTDGYYDRNGELTAYDNPYYNDALDFDQQDQEFWENL